MPEENKIKKENPKVDIDTSGPEVDVTLPCLLYTSPSPRD